MESEGEYVEPPANTELERSVLGCAFLDNDVIPTIQARIDVKAFRKQRHRIIWRAIVGLYEDDRDVDTLTVGDRLRGADKLEGVGGASYISRLSNSVPTTAHLDSYLRRMAELREKRQQMEIARWLFDRAADTGQPADKVRAKALEDLQSSGEGGERTKLDSGEIADRVDAELSGAGGDMYDLGLDPLDRLFTGGVQAGRFYVITGISKHGKTSLAVDLSRRLMQRHSFAVDFWSTEMVYTDLAIRYLSAISGVELQDARRTARNSDIVDWNRTMTERHEAAFKEGLAEFRSWDFENDLQGAPHIREIEVEARRRLSQLDHGRYAIFVDYLQSIDGDGDSKPERTADVSRRLNDIAKSHNIPVFMLGQYKGSAEDRFEHKGVRPHYNDLKWSSRPSNDANHFICLHRPYIDRDGRDAEYTEIHQDLSRHGQHKAMAELHFDPSTYRFRSWEGAPPPDKAGQSEDEDDREFL